MTKDLSVDYRINNILNNFNVDSDMLTCKNKILELINFHEKNSKLYADQLKDMCALIQHFINELHDDHSMGKETLVIKLRKIQSDTVKVLYY